MSNIIAEIEKRYIKEDIPKFGPGDTVRVVIRIKEGVKERLQVFEGLVIKKHGTFSRKTFTVRKVADGLGVEKTFQLHSPLLKEIKVMRSGKVRRSKLYYLRDRVGTKAIRIKSKAKTN